MHKDVEYSCFDHNPDEDSTTIDFIESKIGTLNKNVKIIKWIPQGARFTAANELPNVVENRVQKNDLNSWKNLLFFAYGTFQIAKRKSESQSLTRIVKNNKRNSNGNLVDMKFETKIQKNVPLSKCVYRIEAKISDGDIRGETKLLMSSDSLINQEDPEIINLTKEKHPTLSIIFNFPATPDGSII